MCYGTCVERHPASCQCRPVQSAPLIRIASPSLPPLHSHLLALQESLHLSGLAQGENSYTWVPGSQILQPLMDLWDIKVCLKGPNAAPFPCRDLPRDWRASLRRAWGQVSQCPLAAPTIGLLTFYFETISSQIFVADLKLAR